MKSLQIRFGKWARLAFFVSIFAAQAVYADDVTITDPTTWLEWLMSRIGSPGG
jgi:hypothetical protein